jgi:hypothetical protein
VENLVLSLVNITGSLILIRISFLTFIIVVAGVSTPSSLLLFITEVVSSALSLPLADIMIVCVCSVALYI